MKKVLLLTLSIIFLASCKKEEEPNEEGTKYAFQADIRQEQEALVTIVTRTECGACGEWGHPTFDNKVEANDHINGLALHFKENDPMSNSFGITWVDLVGWSATPSFGVSLTSQGPDTGNWNTVISDALNTPVQAAVGISGSGIATFTIDVSITFYEAINQNTAIALYVVEDKYQAEQQDYSANPTTVNDYTHNQILRYSVTDVWGNNLGNSFQADETLTRSFQFTPENVTDYNHMKLVAVLFETDANGNPLSVINSRTASSAVLSE